MQRPAPLQLSGHKYSEYDSAASLPVPSAGAAVPAAVYPLTRCRCRQLVLEPCGGGCSRLGGDGLGLSSDTPRQGRARGDGVCSTWLGSRSGAASASTTQGTPAGAWASGKRLLLKAFVLPSETSPVPKSLFLPHGTHWP